MNHSANELLDQVQEIRKINNKLLEDSSKDLILQMQKNIEHLQMDITIFVEDSMETIERLKSENERLKAELGSQTSEETTREIEPQTTTLCEEQTSEFESHETEQSESQAVEPDTEETESERFVEEQANLEESIPEEEVEQPIEPKNLEEQVDQEPSSNLEDSWEEQVDQESSTDLENSAFSKEATDQEPASEEATDQEPASEEATDQDEESAPLQETTNQDEESTPLQETTNQDEESTPLQETTNQEEESTPLKETTNQDEESTSSEDEADQEDELAALEKEEPASSEEATDQEEPVASEETTGQNEDQKQSTEEPVALEDSEQPQASAEVESQESPKKNLQVTIGGQRTVAQIGGLQITIGGKAMKPAELKKPEAINNYEKFKTTLEGSVIIPLPDKSPYDSSEEDSAEKPAEPQASENKNVAPKTNKHQVVRTTVKEKTFETERRMKLEVSQIISPDTPKGVAPQSPQTESPTSEISQSFEFETYSEEKTLNELQIEKDNLNNYIRAKRLQVVEKDGKRLFLKEEVEKLKESLMDYSTVVIPKDIASANPILGIKKRFFGANGEPQSPAPETYSEDKTLNELQIEKDNLNNYIRAKRLQVVEKDGKRFFLKEEVEKLKESLMDYSTVVIPKDMASANPILGIKKRFFGASGEPEKPQDVEDEPQLELDVFSEEKTLNELQLEKEELDNYIHSQRLQVIEKGGKRFFLKEEVDTLKETLMESATSVIPKNMAKKKAKPVLGLKKKFFRDQ